VSGEKKDAHAVELGKRGGESFARKLKREDKYQIGQRLASARRLARAAKLGKRT
jgi:hypothetical protein